MYHFVCGNCSLKYGRKCPCCRTSRLFLNILLEKHLEPQFVNCTNEKCDLKLFEWSLDSQSKDCLYSMTKCDEIIKQDKLKEHLKTNCGNKIEWMEINEIENSVSLGLVEFVTHSSGKSVEVKVKDLLLLS